MPNHWPYTCPWCRKPIEAPIEGETNPHRLFSGPLDFHNDWRGGWRGSRWAGLGMTTIPRTPPINMARIVMVCLGCTHWQCDITPEALTEFDTPDDYINALSTIYHDHWATRCVNPDGRMQIGGRWFEKPTGPSGRPADAVLGGMRLPEWWVWK